MVASMGAWRHRNNCLAQISLVHAQPRPSGAVCRCQHTSRTCSWAVHMRTWIMNWGMTRWKLEPACAASATPHLWMWRTDHGCKRPRVMWATVLLHLMHECVRVGPCLWK